MGTEIRISFLFALFIYLVISKVFTCIILDRISGILETGIWKEQAGF
jgi:hypothetical protein